MDMQAQPQAMDVEDTLLGIILNEPKAYKEVKALLTPDTFYNMKNVEVYRAIEQAAAKGNVDTITVVEQLKDNGKLEYVDGVGYIMQLSEKTKYSIHAIECARIIFEKHIRREVILSGQLSIRAAHDESVDEFSLMDGVRERMLKIYKFLSSSGKRTISEIADSYLKDILEKMRNGGRGTGIRTYIPCLDNRLGGLGRGRMITIAARPGMGKTALVIQIITNIALRNDKRPLVVYTLEMTAEEIVNRIVSCIINYPYSRIAQGDIDHAIHDTFLKCVDYIKNSSNLHIVDNLNDIDSIMFDLKAKVDEFGVEGAIIDYIQICQVKGKKGQNREQEVSDISRGIKGNAKALAIPIIALAQLNREVEKRLNKKPILADLRESGSLEQDSDSVTFIFRPVYAGMEFDGDGQRIEDTEGWFYTEKNRHGAVGVDKVWCDISTNRFKDAEAQQGNYSYKDYSQSNHTHEENDTPF